MTLSDRLRRTAREDPAAAKVRDWRANDRPDLPRAAVSPYTRRALAGELPAKELGR